MFLKFFRAKFFQLVKAAKENAKADSKSLFLDSTDNILKVVDELGNTKAVEPNSGFNGEKKTYRFDLNLTGASGNGATGNITLRQLATGEAVAKVTFLKTGTLTGDTSTVKLALATDGDVTGNVEVVDATAGINDKGIIEPAITYRKASAAQNLRLVVGTAAVTGSMAIIVETYNANYLVANNPVPQG
jgi:hypothetical protein